MTKPKTYGPNGWYYVPAATRVATPPSLREIATSDYRPAREIHVAELPMPVDEVGLPSGDWLVMALNCKWPLVRLYAHMLLRTLAEMPEEEFAEFATELAEHLVNCNRQRGLTDSASV